MVKFLLMLVGCPDSRHAYIVLDDNRKLRDFWVINSISDKPELKKYKYEFPGDKYVTQNELVIIDIVERTARKAKIQKWNDQYVMPFSVTSDSKYVFFERTKRTWDEVDVCSVNTSTLEVKELIHEVDKPYRDPHARSVEVLNDGKDILFRSERTWVGTLLSLRRSREPEKCDIFRTVGKRTYCRY